jgi:hypothetical protein
LLVAVVVDVYQMLVLEMVVDLKVLDLVEDLVVDLVDKVARVVVVAAAALLSCIVKLWVLDQIQMVYKEEQYW